MKQHLAILMMAVVLTACGGGSSETNDAAVPPAPEVPANPGNGEVPQNPAPPAEQNITLSCSSSPHLGTVEPNGQVTATFKFSQTYNGPATIVQGVQGEIATMENTFIDGNQLVVHRNVPGSGKYSIRLNVDGTGLTAVCTWQIAAELELI